MKKENRKTTKNVKRESLPVEHRHNKLFCCALLPSQFCSWEKICEISGQCNFHVKERQKTGITCLRKSAMGRISLSQSHQKEELQKPWWLSLWYQEVLHFYYFKEFVATVKLSKIKTDVMSGGKTCHGAWKSYWWMGRRIWAALLLTAA